MDEYRLFLEIGTSFVGFEIHNFATAPYFNECNALREKNQLGRHHNRTLEWKLDVYGMRILMRFFLLTAIDLQFKRCFHWMQTIWLKMHLLFRQTSIRPSFWLGDFFLFWMTKQRKVDLIHDVTWSLWTSYMKTYQILTKKCREKNTEWYDMRRSDCAIIGVHSTESWMVFLFCVISEWACGDVETKMTITQHPLCIHYDLF